MKLASPEALRQQPPLEPPEDCQHRFLPIETSPDGEVTTQRCCRCDKTETHGL